MKPLSFPLVFGLRLLRREWTRYVLAFLSLFITGVTFTVVLLGVDGAERYLADRSREFLGGDIAFESGSPIDIGPIRSLLEPGVVAEDREIELALSVRSGERATGVSARAVSERFPLYGRVELVSGEYRFPAPDEVYVEPIVLERLGLKVGDIMAIGTIEYRIIGAIKSEPDALVQGFRFAPRLIFSEAGFERSGIVLAESRSEYEYRFRLAAPLAPSAVETVRNEAIRLGLEVRSAGDGRSGFLRRLENVERFFLITVLIGAVLSAVNVYANALSIVSRLRRSFAVFLVQGATKRSIVALVLGIVGAITLLATIIGIAVGVGLIMWLYAFLERQSGIVLALDLRLASLGLVLLGTFVTSLSAAVPALRELLALEPRALLLGSIEAKTQRSFLRLALLSMTAFLPLFLLTLIFLERPLQALLVVGGALGAFLGIAIIVHFVHRLAYRFRDRFGFFFRTIIAEKRADGIFGVVAAASITFALSSIFALTLLERSLERFFDEGIGTTIPSAYFIDVQSDQLKTVENVVPGVTLFPNVRGRMLFIDERDIQKRLEAGMEDRELRREFNLTFRTDLLPSETIVAGSWQGDRRGEVSVEADFAERVSLTLGSTIEFFIQGVSLTARVTSIRSADTTSGLPFFYFVFHPDDLGRFPASYFGYADMSGADLRRAEGTLAERAPNVSVLDTSAIGVTVREVTNAALALVRVVTLPPLILALLLLVSLLMTTFADRERDALRLRVLGATKPFTVLLYLAETVLTVLFVSLLSLALAFAIVFIATRFVFDALAPVYFDPSLLTVSVILLFALVGYAGLLLISGRRNLRSALAYEENN